MAAPEEGGTEALPPPPPAEDEPPGEAAVCGAPLTVVAGAAARPAAEEEAEGAVGPVDPPPPAEGPELLAVTEELAQSLVALEAGAAAGTVLYLQADGSLVEGAGLSAEEQRRLLEQLLAAAESPGPGTAEPSPPPPRHAATPLAPAELLRVIEQVSKAQEQQKPPPAAPLEPCPGPPPCRGGGCPPPRDAGPVPPQACGAAPPRASIMHNAAQQLQSVAQQVALQQGKSMAAARLLPQKQLEAICVQVQPGQMKETERPMPSLAPIQSKTITLSQSTRKSAESRHMLAEQQNETSSGHRGPITPKGPGRPRRPKRRGRPRMGGRSRCSGRLSRPGQSPSKSLSSVSAEHNVFRRKARLKELIQQCDNEDLMELALPRLTKLVTVYEFLLMKVEKGYPAKAYFPDVYREFEDLHNMVKKMAYDHLSNSDLLSCQQPVEIKDAKVAESLGITEILTGERKTQGVDSCSQRIIKMVSEQVPVEILGQKRLAESSGEELLPSAKRTKLEDLTENVNNAYASQDEVKEKSGNLCTLFEKDGFNPLNGEILLSEDRHITCGTTGSTLLTAEEHNSFADSGVRINAENSGTFSQTVKMRIEYSQPVNIQGPDMAGNTSLLHTEVVLPVEADGSPELVQAHFVSENSAGGLSAPKLCDSVLENAVGSHSTDLPTSEENGHNEKYQKLQEENRNFAVKEHSEQLHNADMTDEMQELEKVFATNIVPINYPHSAQTESRQNPVQESSLSAHVNHENSFKDVNAFSCGMEEQHELENTVTVDETVAFEITDESHDFLSQGHEQIFIQTSGGLILSHPDTAVLSQAEGIVIVTDSNGTTMHIRTPEGIPLETVEALLAMEADGQSEDILLSQSELEP
ncbi:zinc finger protein 839 isoform X5 [Balearica regulorum gibbericeps]|uniref:zinc finger protein 839 isoform X5 n=1 Tax=Balearica regulorum gibbericeps TaxID=100784 RepID=UPI003F5E32D1